MTSDDEGLRAFVAVAPCHSGAVLPLTDRAQSDEPPLLRRLHPAVVLLWAGLTALAALSAAAVEVYAESATQCDGLLQPRGPEAAGVCGALYDQREGVVRALVVLAVALLLLAVASAVRCRSVGARPVPAPADVEVDLGVGAAVLTGLVAPLGALVLAMLTYLVVLTPGTETSQGLPRGWQHVGHVGGVVVGCLLLRSSGLTRASALAAAAVGVPSVLLAVVLTGHLLDGSDVDTSARVSANPLVWLAAGVPVVLALLAVAALQRRGRAAPGPLVRAALVLLSATVTTVVLLPQVLPAFRDARGGGPYPFGGLDVGTWLPLLVATLVLSVLTVTWSYLGRRPQPTSLSAPGT